MCADFSNHRIRKTENIFFEAAKNSAIPGQTIQKIHALHEILKGNSNEKNTASHVISSIASRLYWLATDTFSTPVTQGLLQLMSEVEPLGLDIEHYSHETNDVEHVHLQDFSSNFSYDHHVDIVLTDKFKVNSAPI